jgi:outer membrane immunogenic protein
MRALLVAAGGIMLVNAVNPAGAADIRSPPTPAPVPPPVYNWTGFYIGGNVGYGWSHRDFANTITGTLGSTQLSASNSGSDNGRGWLGGGQIGYNYQFLGNWVGGIEADIDAAHITSSANACFAGFGTGVCGTRDTARVAKFN